MDYLRFHWQRLVNLWTSMFPSAPKWGFDEMPDLTGRVAVVTGGNAGIGKVMCRELLAHGARVYMLCRSPSKAESAIAELKLVTGKSAIHTIACDLSSLPSVLSAARELLDQEKQVHLLFCNAGLFMCPREEVTVLGHDMSFGVNVLAHAYLVKLLLPTMDRTAETSPERTVRVVITSSSAANLAPKNGIDYRVLKDSPERTRRYDSYLSYFQSKWANVAYTHALCTHHPLASHGVVFVSNDPGYIKTQIWDWQDPVRRWLRSLVLYDTEHGALTPLYAGTAEGVRHGGCYTPWAREGRSRGDTDSPELQEKLWEWVEGELEAQPEI
ncbi:NAD-binding protein [Calocera viscosa TUFC12733]|uniref:NAD-binding protein n=1 Tax=Calocera viscosa (strain TUFC12733) TaxID=1330018 RepID=A0A167PZV3_CALVF|nr:NAD-binding protein [Calocera viscosa TUFC12733]